MSYPKMLVMRNSPNGLIWQSYNVLNEQEERILTKNATENGFIVQTEKADYTDETTPGWRDEPCWAACLVKDRIEKEGKP